MTTSLDSIEVRFSPQSMRASGRTSSGFGSLFQKRSPLWRPSRKRLWPSRANRKGQSSRMVTCRYRSELGSGCARCGSGAGHSWRNIFFWGVPREEAELPEQRALLDRDARDFAPFEVPGPERGFGALQRSGKVRRCSGELGNCSGGVGRGRVALAEREFGAADVARVLRVHLVIAARL